MAGAMGCWLSQLGLGPRSPHGVAVCAAVNSCPQALLSMCCMQQLLQALPGSAWSVLAVNSWQRHHLGCRNFTSLQTPTDTKLSYVNQQKLAQQLNHSAAPHHESGLH